MCDDDARFMRQLKSSLKDFFEARHTGQPEFMLFSSGEELISSGENADIAFLDVEMPGVSGIHAGKLLKQANPRTIIFIITAYTEYLDEAMQFNVYRYLSKPLDRNRLYRNMNEALITYSSQIKKVTVQTRETTVVLYTDEIVYLECIGGRVYIYTAEKIYESIRNMQYWNSVLPSNMFYRTYRSYIVNFKYITSYDSQSICLRYGNNMQGIAYLARRKARGFVDAYLLYLESL